MGRRLIFRAGCATLPPQMAQGEDRAANAAGARMLGRIRRIAGSGGAWVLILALAACARVDPPRPPAAAPATDAKPRAPAFHATTPRFADRTFVTTDGERLPLRKWLPQGPVRAVILALHGFNDYSRAFATPAALWAADGIATYAYDQRGFGAAPERGRWAGRAALATDAAAACGVLRGMYPGVPLYLLGDSMGGAIAIITATGDSGTPVPDIDGVILIAPAVWGRPVMDLLPKVALFVGVRFLPAMTLTGRSLHILASDNIPMLRALGRDPLVIKATRVATIWGLVNLMDAALAAAPRLHVPVLVLYGAHDEIIPKRAMRRFIETLPHDPSERRSVAYYRRGYHMLLRDLEGPIVSGDVAGWILSPGAPLASGADRVAFAADPEVRPSPTAVAGE
jgi:alpha-beta hydrolase superfamily lysophospholipase